MVSLFTRHHLYLTAFFLLPIMYFFSLPIFVGDLAMWVTLGKHILTHGEILRQDIFSVLPTTEMIYSVGSAWLYAVVYQFSGLDAVVILHRIFILGILVLWYRSSFAHLKNPWNFRNIFFILFTWVGSSMLLIDRPALLAMLPFVLAYLLLQKPEELTVKDIFWLNVINVCWLNIHGSWFILGVMYFWREATRVLVLRYKISLRPLIGLMSIAVTSLMNPFGYKVIPYVFETSRISKERKFDEWASVNPTEHTMQFWAFSLLFVGAVMFLFYLLKKERAKVKVFLASPFVLLLALGFLGVRNTLWSFYVLIPTAFQFGLIRESADLINTKNSEVVGFSKAFINATIILVFFVLTFFLFPQNKHYIAKYLPADKQATYGPSAPIEFAKYLSETAEPGNIFNDAEYGSYLMLAQPNKIFLDARNIIFENESYNTYFVVADAEPDWENVLNKYKIKYLLLDKKLRANLIEKVNATERWKNVKEDEYAVLFVRL